MSRSPQTTMSQPPEHVGQKAYSELFAAAEAALDWLRMLRAWERPVGQFNRLQDAINSVREAHQMEGFDWPAPGEPADTGGADAQFWKAEWFKLDTEREKLKAALEVIAKGVTSIHDDELGGLVEVGMDGGECSDVARAALAQTAA